MILSEKNYNIIYRVCMYIYAYATHMYVYIFSLRW